MDRLWAPWRDSYVSAAKAPQPDDACFICQGVAAAQDRDNLIVQRGPWSVVLLNRFPYNNGHLLVAPIQHKATLEELHAEQILDMHSALTQMVGALDHMLQPDGFTIGVNLGRAAGAGLPGHLHWHVVPRWIGDTNFMPVLGDAKVISQSLEALYDMLIAYVHSV